MTKFDLPTDNNIISNNKNEINYELVEVKNSPRFFGHKELLFKSLNPKSQVKLLSIDLIKGNAGTLQASPEFILNKYHSSQLVDIMLNHASEHDFCLIGPQGKPYIGFLKDIIGISEIFLLGSGKTELIKQFANMLEYNMHTIYLYKDMSTRDLLQQRITMSNGDTVWHNSPLINACLVGDLVVLDGIHRLRDDTLMSLRRLIQDRELDLSDGTKLLRHDKYDQLVKEAEAKGVKISENIKKIDPAFRLVATAEPPVVRSSVKIGNESTEKSTVKSGGEWLNSEILNLFMFQSVEALSPQYEKEILSNMFKLNSQHNQLIKLITQLRQASLSSDGDAQLKHISKLFSLRKLIRISKQLDRYLGQDLLKLVEDACLFKFMPQLNKQIFTEFLEKNKFYPKIKMDQQSEYDDLKQSLNSKVKKLLEMNQGSETQEKLNMNAFSKIPDTLFFENNLHTRILNNIMQDFELGEHILLIGNQG